MNFADRLISEIKKKAPICVGLDPVFEQIPKCIQPKLEKESGKKVARGDIIYRFNQEIIDAIYDLVPVVKPQLAFYERWGLEGIKAFLLTIQYAKTKGLMVIADGKRNDIGSTAEGYAAAYLDPENKEGFGPHVDALTVNPYLGSDGITPFLKSIEKYPVGIFVLVKTSNPSSGEIQGLGLKDETTVMEQVATLVNKWGEASLGLTGYSGVGAVIGATYPKEAHLLRKLMPQQIFLVPGYGAQGGGVKEVEPCFNKNGLGAIINSSRGIIFAYEKDPRYSPENYPDAAREAVLAMKKDLQQISNQ